jgi:hypothetical protein
MRMNRLTREEARRYRREHRPATNPVDLALMKERAAHKGMAPAGQLLRLV